MILPTDKQCRDFLDELDGEPNLTEWEHRFIESNKGRQTFTPLQKESIAEMMEKYEA